MQNSRLFQILYLLMAKNGMTATEIAEKTEVSKRTIQRDIDALSAAGIPIYTTRGRGGGVFLMPEFVLDKSLLSADEQSEILYALKSLQAAGIENDLADRLAGQFGTEYTDWIDIDFSYWGASPAEQAMFAQIKHAILQRHALRFDYFAPDGAHTTRTVQPYRLCFRGTNWYVQGVCTQRQAFRTFKLTRMRDLAVLADTFERTMSPPPLDVAPWVSPMVLLHLLFDASVSHQVYDMFATESITRERDDALRVVQQYPDTPWVIQFLLSFGASVQVLDPPHIREALQAEIKKMQTLY